ncbi:LuxR C-terminal-related transcriptional regulator [Facklamia sp. 7083-14-GEN3]|uniref:LuxR C-terminal-related transcriptional regulator n=1 Tax=Facklamia sp. 7083-14-GEN3 TaxID=2973478 RepID=UPI00215C1482|nr:LuxR C-terminal-related transcriptional regulator [Facklamia sp. 7083-14-GEN3]MCR8968925.1 LuxR C-terminal-related transcriptional regulator [Facklamia sp. 7083-14-GEN3]
MKKTQEELTNVIILFDPLIHHCLHHYQLSVYDIDYQDHLQEMRLELLRLYQNFQGDPLNCQDDRYQFVAYAGKGLRWFLLNRFRQSAHQVTPTDPLTLSDLIEEAGEAETQEAQYLLEQSAKEHLTRRELKIFNLILKGKWLNWEICQLCQISERTLRYDKKRIANKLRHLFDPVSKDFLFFLPVLVIKMCV